MFKLNKKRIIRILELLIHILSYAIILQLMSMIFNSVIQIDNSSFGIWGILVSLVIYILNKTVKPIIVKLTLPITGLTMGLFYFVINYFIIKLGDWIFVNRFNINGLMMGFLVAVIITLLNVIIDKFIIEPILKKEKKNESNISRNR